MNSKLKLCEVFLLQDEWKLSFNCFVCGSQLEQIDHFLLHYVLEHLGMLVTSDEVFTLIQQTVGVKIAKGHETDGHAIVVEDNIDNVDNIKPKSTESSYYADSDFEVTGESDDHHGPATVYKRPKIVSTSSTSRRHKQNSAKDRMYTCKTCGSSWKDFTNYSVHIKRHLGIKPFTCNLCDKCFTTTTELKLHMRTHTGERPYKCQFCGESFTSSSVLALHRRRVHTKERPHMCTYCAKTFLTLKQMREHEAAHTNERNNVCPVCKKSFARRSVMLKHAKLHSDLERNTGLQALMQSDIKTISIDNAVLTENQIFESCIEAVIDT